MAAACRPLAALGLSAAASSLSAQLQAEQRLRPIKRRARHEFPVVCESPAALGSAGSSATATGASRELKRKEEVFAAESSPEVHRSGSSPSNVRLGLGRGALLRQNPLPFDQLYEKKCHIGTGGSGSVWRCTHKALKIDVAVKFITAESVGSKLNFANELEALTKLDHPFIVRLLEYFVEQDHFILVSQLCAGPDLLDHMLSRWEYSDEPFEEDEAGRFVRQILKALRGCHQQGVVHKDVKPENFVFAQKLGGKMTPPLKLIDLGVSEIRRDGESRKGEVSTGTDCYAAPEVIIGAEYGTKADLWGVGCIVFMLLLCEPLVPIDIELSQLRRLHEVGDLVERRLQETNAADRISPAALKFIRGLLNNDQRARFTVEEALQHDFIKSALRKTHFDLSVKPFADEAVERIQNFVKMPALRRLAHFIIARFCPDDDSSRSMRNFFRAVDRDGDGLITVGELTKAVEATGATVPRKWRLLLRRLVDDAESALSDDQTLAYEQFLAGTLPPEVYLQADALNLVWQCITADQQSSIGAQDLVQFFPDRSPKELQSLVAEVTGDKDSRITFRAFERIINKCGLADLSTPVTFDRQCVTIDRTVSRAVPDAASSLSAVVQNALADVVTDCTFSVTVADPNIEHCPLIAVSEEFERMTGFQRREIIGSNCRFLNEGCELSGQDKRLLRYACKTGAPYTGILENRRKSGDRFMNFLDLRGMVVARNYVTGQDLWFVVGIQADVTESVDAENLADRLPQLKAFAECLRAKIGERLSTMAVSGAMALQTAQTSSADGYETAEGPRLNGSCASEWRLLPRPVLVAASKEVSSPDLPSGREFAQWWGPSEDVMQKVLMTHDWE
eukprot:TRINITY_DN14476_c0_g1_i1.p1 TRINITY_DN14476_c0_g1~~TRINITY_DN14476_c0_g1_i1.p1  ORF type:complete len:869 (+),score=179.01 TRINITY_DN14476_c0_g1_i1:63-2609(+)